jgi:hypothetical protein
VLITDKEPCKFAVNKRQNTNYSFLPVTSKLFNVKYLPLFHHFKAIYQFPKHIIVFPKHIIVLVKIVANAPLKEGENLMIIYVQLGLTFN